MIEKSDSLHIRKSLQQGFTLLEILVVVAIIAILAAIAIPSYNRYVITAAITEGLVFAEEERIRIELFYEEQGRMPNDETEANLITGPVDRIQQILWRQRSPQSGDLEIVMNLEEFNSDFGPFVTALVLHGQANANGSVSWNCQPSSDIPAVPANYLPSSCQ